MSPGVVDQDCDRAKEGFSPGNDSGRGFETGDIANYKTSLGTYGRSGFLKHRRPAPCQDDLGPSRNHATPDGQPQPCAPARDQGDFALQTEWVGPGGNVRRLLARFDSSFAHIPTPNGKLVSGSLR
jgi:hypothetical protein